MYLTLDNLDSLLTPSKKEQGNTKQLKRAKSLYEEETSPLDCENKNPFRTAKKENEITYQIK